MSFILGLDVGTASGAGATKRDGRVQPCALGNRTATLPSVVVLHDDGTSLVGEEAEQVVGFELPRIARDVRLDPAQRDAPIKVGGQFRTPHELLRTFYGSIVERVCLSQNATPSHIVLTHPPVPEGMRCDMVERIADELFPGALVVPEPIAAAVKLACDGSLPVDCVVAVYDLGGTFDVTLVGRDGDRFSVVGEPSGLPHCGGIDVDDLVLDHVNRRLDGAVARLDLATSEAMAALTRLRADCRHAKERLSYETEVTIDASMPEAPSLVHLTRSELDDALLPQLEGTIDLLERVVADAGLGSRDVDAVALVGGSSRIPLVADLMGRRTSIPVLVDPYPELTVALGAAQMVDDDAPRPSVLPFAELALPSLAALSGAGRGARMSTPSGGHATLGALLDGSVGRTDPPTNGRRLGMDVGEAVDDTEFDKLVERGRDLDATTGGRLVDAEVGTSPGTALGRAASQGLDPRVGVGVVVGLVVAVLIAVLLLGGGSEPEQAETTGASGTTGDDGTTSSSSSSSSSTTTSSETTSTTADAGAIPPVVDPTTTDDPGPPTTTEEPPDPPTPPTTRRPTTTTTTRPPTTTTTSTSTTSTTSTTLAGAEASSPRT